jgi:hypothetical protein
MSFTKLEMLTNRIRTNEHPFTNEEKQNLLQLATWLEKTKLPQGTGYLRTKILENPNRTGAFCAWGIYAWYKKEGLWARDRLSLDAYLFALNDEINDEVLPERYLHETGALKFVPGAQRTIQFNIVFMNDSQGYTFDEIALEIRHLVEHNDWTEETRFKLYDHGEL